MSSLGRLLTHLMNQITASTEPTSKWNIWNLRGDISCLEGGAVGTVSRSSWQWYYSIIGADHLSTCDCGICGLQKLVVALDLLLIDSCLFWKNIQDYCIFDPGVLNHTLQFWGLWFLEQDLCTCNEEFECKTIIKSIPTLPPYLQLGAERCRWPHLHHWQRCRCTSQHPGLSRSGSAECGLGLQDT